VLLGICLTCFESDCAADDFSMRVVRAKSIENSSAGQAYQQGMWAQIGDATANFMQQCFPQGTKADTDAFCSCAPKTDQQTRVMRVEN
jgi:hypothetical protein